MLGAVFAALGILVLPLCWAVIAVTGHRTAANRRSVERAQHAMIAAAITIPLAIATIRAWSLASGTSLSELVGVQLASPVASDQVLQAWGRLVLLISAISLVPAIGAALVGGKGQSGMVLGASSLAETVGAVLAVAMSVSISVLVIAQPKAWAVALPLDLASAAPLLGVAVAFALLASPAEATPGSDVQPIAVDVAPFGSDPLPILRSARALGRERQRWPAITGSGEDAELWTSAGGVGPPPVALDAVFEAITSGKSARIPDVPGETEEVLLAALILESALVQGRRVLVVFRDPPALKKRIDRAIELMGSGEPARVVATRRELSDALAAHRLPAVIIADVASLSDAVIPLLSRSAREFILECNLVVVSRPDRLDPVRASHLHFACARLSLLAAQAGLRRRFIVTAMSAPEVSRSIDALLGIKSVAIHLALRARNEVVLFDGLTEGGTGAAAISASVRRAHEALVSANINVSVEDAAALLNSDDLAVGGSAARLDEPATLRGSVCLVIASEDQLTSIYRVAQNRMAHLGKRQVIVVWWLPSPLTSFLTEGNRLGAQLEDGTLPSPAPVFSTTNGYVQELHLRRAVQEGEPDEDALRRLFAEGAIAKLLASGDAKVRGERTTADVEGGVLRRSRIIVAAKSAEHGLSAGMTVTRAVAKIVDGQSGDVIEQVDRLTAQTHYYPYKVFSYRGRRYEVPSDGGSRGRDEIVVRSADANKEPTTPLIEFEVSKLRTVGGEDRRAQGAFVIRTRTDEIEVTETLRGAISGNATIEFPPVTARYRTQLRVVFFEHLAGHDPGPGLDHIARVLDDVLLTHLRVRDEYLEVEAFNGYGGENVPALVFIDRRVGGVGVADALGLEAVFSMLKWTQALMKSCPCMHGCERCTPSEVLHHKAKQSAIQLLGG